VSLEEGIQCINNVVNVSPHRTRRDAKDKRQELGTRVVAEEVKSKKELATCWELHDWLAALPFYTAKGSHCNGILHFFEKGGKFHIR
jgi:hypothetical protein